MMARRTVLAVILSGLILDGLHAQVSFDRLREVAREPQNWLTYSGSYFSQRYSPLNQITPDNVGNVELQWVYQTGVIGPWQATPLVVDDVMYVTQRPNDVVALDARTGRVFWVYRYPTAPGQRQRLADLLHTQVFDELPDAAALVPGKGLRQMNGVHAGEPSQLGECGPSRKSVANRIDHGGQPLRPSRVLGMPRA